MTGAARRVLVTGGARGIGGAVVEQLAGQGFAVDFTWHRAAAEAAALGERLGDRVRGFACDLADGAAVEDLARSLDQADAYYGLVHNAGVAADGLAALVDQAAAERVFAVNFWSMVRLVRAVLRPMLAAKRGRIVLIAGRQARPVFPVGPFYVKGLSLHGFAMFNATADEQRHGADDMNRWMAEGKLKPPVGRVFPLSEAAAAHRFLEENTLGGAGTLLGKVVLVP